MTPFTTPYCQMTFMDSLAVVFVVLLLAYLGIFLHLLIKKLLKID